MQQTSNVDINNTLYIPHGGIYVNIKPDKAENGGPAQR